jgi:solute carrier family 8 (sodium/calcium exchanger)
MELEGLKRGLQCLEDAGLHIESLVTDRHCMIKKYMKENHEDKNHFFDVWHVAKGRHTSCKYVNIHVGLI